MRKKTKGADGHAGLAAATLNSPQVDQPTVQCPKVVAQERVFSEAHRQAKPLVDGSARHARRVARIVRKGNANPRGTRMETAYRQAISPREVADFQRGAHPKGKLAEVVAVSDYREMHAGRDPGIVNAPQHVAKNVRDIRVSPDSQSRKDLVFGFESSDGRLILKYNGQVKTGGGQYVADSLAEMARTEGYGKVGYIDAKFVNPDGSPRVAADAFTPAQARKLQEAGVRLRGIPDLEARAERLGADLQAHQSDGLSPRAREELRLLRRDINTAYRGRAVAGRVAGGAAVGAVSAALASLAVQLATNGSVDVSTVKGAAGTGAAYGAGGAAADAALYHTATRALGMAPEAAKTFAQNGVAVGFCVIAVGIDVYAEAGQLRRGEITGSGAVAGSSMKVALNLLPLVMAPLGLAGLPLLVGAQIGGRWIIEKAREEDRVVEQAIVADIAIARGISERMNVFTQTVEDVTSDCKSTDAIFFEIMGNALPSAQPTLRLVKN